MPDSLIPLTSWFSSQQMFTLLRLALLVFIGLPLSVVLGNWTHRYIGKRFSAQQGMIAGKIVQYSLLALVIITALNQLGFSLTPLLGAAGVVGIAIGFASQTSVSNVISGIFLIAEEPFVVGDIVTIADTTGYVLSVDILSVKIRTFDNRYIRIPNETIIKNQVTNVTRFPIRRLDVNVSVAYKEDIKQVREILLKVAFENPICLQEPEALVIFSGFGNSSIDLLFAVWTNKENYLKLKNSIQEEIKERFDQAKIEIPFPHLSLYTGAETKPFPVTLVADASTSTMK